MPSRSCCDTDGEEIGVPSIWESAMASLAGAALPKSAVNNKIKDVDTQMKYQYVIESTIESATNHDDDSEEDVCVHVIMTMVSLHSLIW